VCCLRTARGRADAQKPCARAQESQRLLSVLPILFRQARADVRIGGLLVPRGTFCIVHLVRRAPLAVLRAGCVRARVLSAAAAAQMAMHLSPHNFEHAEVRDAPAVTTLPRARSATTRPKHALSRCLLAACAGLPSGAARARPLLHSALHGHSTLPPRRPAASRPARPAAQERWFEKDADMARNIRFAPDGSNPTRAVRRGFYAQPPAAGGALSAGEADPQARSASCPFRGL